jgi:beta-lactamase regulating signal transducer with metallopeptidase domain
VIVYSVLSLAIACARRRKCTRAKQLSIPRASRLLFALRMFPFLMAALITAAFTVPSFLLLEPRAIDEPVGALSLTLAAAALILALAGISNAIRALRKASRAVASWTSGALPAASIGSVPLLTISPSSPAMIATGILRPRILLSAAAKVQLTAAELHATLNHELAHVHRSDNLKKLLMRFVAFPGMRHLESAWLEATEMAADDAAVATACDPLDLAAALIKLSRIPEATATELTTAFVHGPASALQARVERLLAWSEARPKMAERHSRREPAFAIAAAFLAIAVLALTYSQLLVHLHTATEWLVR